MNRTRRIWQTVLEDWLGRPLEITDLEVIRDWSSSQVIRLSTRLNGQSENIYGKLARDGGDAELGIYELAAQVPDFPAPVGCGRLIQGERWLLLRQAQGVPLYQTKDPEQYRAAAQALAAFHQLGNMAGWATRLPSLPSLVDHLQQLVPTICDRVQGEVTGGAFSNVDLDLLCEVESDLLWNWEALRGVLACYPINLLHGDAHSGNLFIDGGKIQLIDWAGAALGPGMLDLVGLIDTGLRMNEPLGDPQDLLQAYWSCLSAKARQQYAAPREAYQVLRICRALLELDWFTQSGDDYGERTNRELNIIQESLWAL
ncbi:MAG: phosphotransferase family protein [Bacillota bacterium]|jgi:hypothetical protein